MSRLDNIVARNQRPHWSRNPVYRAIAIAVLVVVVIALAVLTDLGQSKAPTRGAGRVEDIQLRAPPRPGSASTLRDHGPRSP